ncbi:cation-transporting ATPase fly, putative [Pediculus humanus corporis]|uniref:Cation-transporting ATPase n=1 Tax=Pediculus humanus subsp. corporis TaxID=121224 RepID=E0VGV9_PEDHC|nr:cation-transporting ATPase fly, putative [Pediculus humanus corporis]EEB12615.1 cation-transporting ATPase fly, putative [Pediculus humanus corporis]
MDMAGFRTGKKHEQNDRKQFKLGDEDMEVHGYRKHYCLYFFTWFMIIITCGILRLIFHWCPHWMLLATHVRCGLHRASTVLIVDKYHKHKNYHVKKVVELTKNTINEYEEKNLETDVLTEVVSYEVKNKALPLHVGNGIFKDCDTIRMFRCKKLSYYWDEGKKMFRKLDGLDRDVTTAALHKQSGLTAQEQFLRRIVYGRNEIVIPAKGIFTLLWFEVLNPFYIFQICSFILWFVDDYFYYAMAILLMSAMGIIASIIQTRKNQSKLRSTVHSVDVVNVVRGNGKTCTITTEQLVPGDVIIIPSHGCVMQCDAVLLAGNCIVNEAMLTGESVPVTKTPLPNFDRIPYDSREHAKHTLFCGTQVIQTRYYGDENVCAVVIRTGFYTSKGSLVRSIMYPPPVDFKFEHDSYKFVALLAVTAFIGFIYTSITKYLRGFSFGEITVEALDLITIAVPPALPAAMTVGRMYAQSRLQKKGIYCISPRSINVSGSIDCVCFDKTGTLTEDGLDMWGVVPVSEKKCQNPVTDPKNLERSHILYGMVTCHSLTIIDGKLSGDPLDLKMFESTDWILEEPDVSDNTKFEIVHPTIVRPKQEPSIISSPEIGDDGFRTGIEIGIIRQFPFSSSLQRMSVITKTLGEKDFVVYCKGSPEMILSLSKPQSVPSNFNTVLREYTEEGYRVLAIGYRPLVKISYAKVQRIQREDVEQNLTLLGLVVLENKLKPQTTGVITELRDANIRTIIVTGDNMMTALSVARDCGIVPTGQRVILVHSSQAKKNEIPVLHYTNSYCALPSSISCCETAPNANTDTCVVSISSLTSASDITDLGYSASTEPRVADYSFAITGSTWSNIQTYYPDLVPKMLTRGAVFARMSPDQKQLLVEELQGLGYYVAMCGDGANDCGALKAANAGVSLSDAESSVASPFTSKHANISCIPMVIREGRAALITSFGIFKYVASYSLIQFISVLILYSIDTDLTDIQFLYIDLFIITIFVFFFGKTESYDGPLSKKTPLASLMSFSPILSLFLQITLVTTTTAADAAAATVRDPSDSIIVDNSTTTMMTSTANLDYLGEMGCYENYAVFGVSSLQYIILAIVFSKGKPYRKSLFANYGLLASIVFVTSFTVYLILDPASWLIKSFELMVPPDYKFRTVILIYGAVNFAISCFIEYFIVDYVAFKKLRYRFHNIDKSKKKYLAIEKEMKHDLSWPVISKDVVGDKIPEMTPPEDESRVREKNEERDQNHHHHHHVGEPKKFERPNFEFGDLPSITDFGKTKFNRVNAGGRIRRYSENSNNNVGNEFLKMSVPNLSLNGFAGNERSKDNLS